MHPFPLHSYGCPASFPCTYRTTLSASASCTVHTAALLLSPVPLNSYSCPACSCRANMNLGVSSPGHTWGLVLVTAVLMQAICMAITFLHFTNEIEQLREECSKSAIGCLMGENLGLFHRTLEPRDVKDGDEEHDPCWQVKQQLRIFIKKILLKNYQADISSAVKGEISRLLPRVVDEKYGSKFPMPRIAAHVTGKVSSSEENPLSRKILGTKLQTWDTETGLSLLNNVDFRNGELLIRKTGFYYIYAQTYFRYHEPDRADNVNGPRRVKQMVQYIYKATASYPEPILLMKSAKTTCWSKKAEFGLFSIYQGGIFEVKYNDSIFISVSDKNLIDMDKEASFFGAFLIG